MGMIAELLPIIASVVSQAPQFISDMELIWNLARQHGSAPTPEQEAQWAAIQQDAHKALQAS